MVKIIKGYTYGFLKEIIKQMINCHISVCDIYFHCTNLFVHFVAIYIPLCAIADDRTSSFCCLYRWAIYDL